jgi:hypothetical protein
VRHSKLLHRNGSECGRGATTLALLVIAAYALVRPRLVKVARMMNAMPKSLGRIRRPPSNRSERQKKEMLDDGQEVRQDDGEDHSTIIQSLNRH